MLKTIWIDDWQMQCCGEPFAVGNAVSWSLRDPESDWLGALLGAERASSVDAAEEHHTDGVEAQVPSVTGTVRSIEAVHCRYEPKPNGDPRMLYPVGQSAVITPVQSADGWTPDKDELRFVGYLVLLETPS